MKNSNVEVQELELNADLVEKLGKADERKAASMVAALIASQVPDFAKKD